MLAKVQSAAVVGIDGHLVEVEVNVSGSGKLEQITVIVGLPDAAIRESKERVRAAIYNSGQSFPKTFITVNLAPANLKKEGTFYDLPIALGILGANDGLPGGALDRLMVVGELALDGGIRPVRGALQISMLARELQCDRMIIPEENAAEAAVVEGVDVYGMKSLAEVIDFLWGRSEATPTRIDREKLFSGNSEYPVDMAEVKGQEHVKRALEVAVAGGHNILLIGPPGSGKTMLARRLPTIMPDMTFDEAVETTKVHSIAGVLSKGKPLLTTRSFRSPHHTVSNAGLIGGGSYPSPGEVSLAHNGILFLDELPEFKRDVLEVMRQPMEDGCVTISRAAMSLSFPARFVLCAAMNPCPCGYRGDARKECTCTSKQVERYVSRISGPLLDRIDIQVEVGSLPREKIMDGQSGEKSAAIRERVNKARKTQMERYAGSDIYCNDQIPSKMIRRICAINDDSRDVLTQAVDRFGLSARAYTRILKVARTIADLENAAGIETPHLLEAIQYRTLDRYF